MAYSIATILASVAELYAAVTHSLGWKERDTRSTSPRIVWDVGDRDEYQPAQWPGGEQPPIWTVVTPVDVVMFAADDESLEVMRQNEIAAIHRALSHGSYSISSGSRALGNKELLTDGKVYVLSMSIYQPITNDISDQQIGIAESTLHSVEIDFPSSTVACGHDAEPE